MTTASRYDKVKINFHVELMEMSNYNIVNFIFVFFSHCLMCVIVVIPCQ